MPQSMHVLMLMSTALTVTAADPVPTYVAARHRVAISAWLSHHPGYRLAVDTDCSCKDDIAPTRAGAPPDWPPLPDYHPSRSYRRTGKQYCRYPAGSTHYERIELIAVQITKIGCVELTTPRPRRTFVLSAQR